MKHSFHGNIVLALSYMGRARRNALASALTEYNFPVPMYDIAMYADRHPGSSQDSIAEMTRYDKATIARDAQKLEAGGYLIRKNSERDRRQYELYLTESGKKLADDARAAALAWQERITRGFTDLERNQVLYLLQRMAENMD